MKLVSIILPTYNGANYIKDALDSILKQTYTNWEVIIVDDCSTDNTLEIIQEYAQKDNRIKIITNNTNKKLPASLNIGFEAAHGEYFTWTSDDNMYKENAIEYMADFLDKNTDVDLVSCNFDFINEDGSYNNTFTNLVKNRCPLQLVKQCNVGACFMYRKGIAQKVGKYNTDMFCAEDYDYWCRVAIAGNIAYSNENLYKYRLNPQSLTATKQQTIKEKTLAVQNKYKKDLIKLYKFKHPKFYLKNILLKDTISFIYSKEKLENKKVFKILGIKISINKRTKDKDYLTSVKPFIP